MSLISFLIPRSHLKSHVRIFFFSRIVSGTWQLRGLRNRVYLAVTGSSLLLRGLRPALAHEIVLRAAPPGHNLREGVTTA